MSISPISHNGHIRVYGYVTYGLPETYKLGISFRPIISDIWIA